MDNPTLLAVTDFARTRLLGTLEAIEKSGRPAADVLSYRPGPKRAHLAWQFLHCGATHDKYFNAYLRGEVPTDPNLVTSYGGGSTPADPVTTTFADIRATLEKTFSPYRSYIAQTTPAELARTYTLPNGMTRTVGESIILLAWHESHHQGQIHLTWNCYQAHHGLK
jgi:hypothetical protein